MKYRESGMPSEDMWETFFSPDHVLSLLGIDTATKILLDIGCGYGTFSLPMARLISGTVIGIDIDENMINVCRLKAEQLCLRNIQLLHGDITSGAILKQLEPYSGKIDYVSLFNILHCEKPSALLNTIHEFLMIGGKIGIIHWKYEQTPRGPSMEIRPKPENIISWAAEAGFSLKKQVDLPPYHYGMVFVKLKP